MGKINWENRLKELGVLWTHNGDCRKPHALWTSGLHSDTFNNGSKILENPEVLKEIVNALLKKAEKDIEKFNPSWVVGPGMGAIVIAYEFARQAGFKFAFTEPVVEEGEKKQVLKRFDIEETEKVIVIEDAISTGGSILKTIKALQDKNIEVAPFVLSIVNWSGKDELQGRKIISLVSRKPAIWESRNCQLCACGSKALRPKSNWDKFIE